MKTYAEMAAELGIRWCGDELRCHHDHDLQGTITYDPPTIHWREGPQTRARRLAFAKLAAKALDPSLAEEPAPWRRVWRLCVSAREIGARLGIRFPAKAWSADKAFVLASVVGLPNTVPDRKRAFDWARR